MAEFGDVWGAANEGTQANQNLFNNYVHNQATNALINAYGPIAGDPQAATQMQNYNYLQSLDPMLLQQQQTENQYNAATLPSRISYNQSLATSAAANAGFDTANVGNRLMQSQGDAQKAAAGGISAMSDARTVQTFQHMNGLSVFGDASERYLQDHPNDAAGAWNAGITAAGSSAADPADVKAFANDQNYKTAFMNNPSEFIKNARAQNAAVYSGIIGTLPPGVKADLMSKNLLNSKTHADITNTTQTMLKEARAAEADAIGQRSAIAGTATTLQNTNNNINRMRALLPQMTSNGIWRGLKADYDKGSPEYEFKELANSVRDNMAGQLFQNVREQAGASVLKGTNTEFTAAGTGLGNLDEGQSIGQIANQLDNVQSYITPAYNGVLAKSASVEASYNDKIRQRQQLENQFNSLNAANPASDIGAPATVQPPYAGGAQPAAAPAAAPSPTAAPPPPAGAAPSASTAGATDAGTALAARPTPQPDTGTALQGTITSAQPGGASGTSAPGWGGGFASSLPVSHDAAAGMARLDPQFAQSMEHFRQDLKNKYGINTVIVSSYRDNDLQARLYANYQARKAGQPLPYPKDGNGGMAAPPGQSQHNQGRAVDMVPADAEGRPDYGNARAQARINQLADGYGIYPGSHFGDYDHYQAGPPGSHANMVASRETTAPETGKLPERSVVASAAPPVQTAASGDAIRQTIPTNPGKPPGPPAEPPPTPPPLQQAAAQPQQMPAQMPEIPAQRQQLNRPQMAAATSAPTPAPVQGRPGGAPVPIGSAVIPGLPGAGALSGQPPRSTFAALPRTEVMAGRALLAKYLRG